MNWAFEIVIPLIVIGAAAYVVSYLRKKGENLATREDVEGLTRKVDEVKGVVAAKLELFKWELGRKATIHRLAAEREFQALAEISDCLHELELATASLLPYFERVDPNEPEEQRHAKRF